MKPASLFGLVVFLLPLSFGSPARVGSPDIAALVASCAHVHDAIKLSPDGNVLCFDGRIRASVPLDDIRKLNTRRDLPRAQSRREHRPRHADRRHAEGEECDGRGARLLPVGLRQCLSGRLTWDPCGGRHDRRLSRRGGTRHFPCTSSDDLPNLGTDEARRKEFVETYAIYCRHREQLRSFYQRRDIKEDFVKQPQTPYGRQMVRALMRDSANKRSIYWTWHPENFGTYFKSKITFLAFPASQEEVDRRLRQLRLPMRAVYDPPENERWGP
jgi:hypothetical protein